MFIQFARIKNAFSFSFVFVLALTLLCTADGLGISWDWGKWWTYDGISGPQFWGLINRDWSLCTQGRRQSPINVDPSILLYDPNLRYLNLDKDKVRGVLNNTGHSIIFTLQNEKENEEEKSYEDEIFRIDGEEFEEMMEEGEITKLETTYKAINLTGGPLSYKYQISHVQFHFGSSNTAGSEHTVNGTSFPAEVQIYAFNSDLYNNFTEAVTKAHGIVAVAILLQVGVQSHAGFRPLTDALQKIRWAETWAWVDELSLRALLPETPFYITYDGSLTQPPCHETVTWILMNRPVYISKQQMQSLRQLRQGNEKVTKARLLNTYRPTQQLLNRPLRTNIDFTNSADPNCPSVAKKMHYKANKWR